MKISIWAIISLLMLGSCNDARFHNLRLYNSEGTPQLPFSKPKGPCAVLLYSFLCPKSERALNIFKQLQLDTSTAEYSYYLVAIDSTETGVMPGVLYDYNKQFVNYTQSIKVPTCFLIDEDGTILYQGKIDDYDIDIVRHRMKPTKNYLQDAMYDVAAKRTIQTKSTEPVGCFIEK